jgi:hypothetical protein
MDLVIPDSSDKVTHRVGCRRETGPNKFSALIALCNMGQPMPQGVADDCAYKPLVEADVILMVDCWVCPVPARAMEPEEATRQTCKSRAVLLACVLVFTHLTCRAVRGVAGRVGAECIGAGAADRGGSDGGV